MAGHVYGSTAWPGVTTGEPPYSERTRAVHFWESFSYPAHRQVCHIKKFLLSEGTAYRKLELSSDDLHPHRTKGWKSDSLDRGAYMMRTDDKKLALLYFEDLCEKSVVKGMEPGETYSAAWFDPRSGEWIDGSVRSYNIHGVSNREFPSKNIYIKAPTAPAEILSLNGYIIEGRVHAHVTLADEEKAFGGHLEKGTNVFTFAVITAGVFSDEIDIARVDDKTSR